ncbi:MAG TPA: alpha/beta hydrolase [Solirubrobacteraceae bacterium]|nr:alpha/beta hydrolase [Solirubrobacteraceae bacterium]
MLPYTESGSGEAVLLIHAGIADRSMWDDHLGWLAQAGFHAVAVDLPGFGEAPVDDGPQAPWEDVLGTLRDLGIERAALVGNSFGAAVALRVAAVAPAAVTAMALISPPAPGLEPSPQLKAVWDTEEAALEAGDVEAAVKAIVDGWTLPDAPEAIRQRVATMQRRAFELQLAVPDAAEAPDPLEQHPEVLERLDVRTLTAAGEHDMRDFIEGAQQLAQTLPDARYVTIGGAGHLAPLETPEAFEELLREFLGVARS